MVWLYILKPEGAVIQASHQAVEMEDINRVRELTVNLEYDKDAERIDHVNEIKADFESDKSKLQQEFSLANVRGQAKHDFERER